MTAGLVAQDQVRTVTAPQLSGRPRKLVRATHIAFSAGWLGLVVAMLTLGITAATAPDPRFSLACYAIMGQIGGAVIPVFAVATLVTGIILSVATPWRLLHHWWVVIKLILALVVIVTAVALTGRWLQQAASAAHAGGSTSEWPAWLLVAGSGFHLLFLWAATTISVDKPWGKTRRGRRATAGRAHPGPGRTSTSANPTDNPHRSQVSWSSSRPPQSPPCMAIRGGPPGLG